MDSPRLKYEGWLYGLAFLIALGFRLIQLGASPLTDSEATLALQAFHIAQGKATREKNYFPGYVMMEVLDGKLNDDMVQHISNISNVMHFLTDGKGSKGNIISLRKSEVNKMLGKVDEMNDQGVMLSEPFIVGETIKIIEGPFNDFNGVIEEVNDEKKKLKVTVKIFGRSTPVELNYMQVEKLS